MESAYLNTTWFVVKKQLEAGSVDIDELDQAFEKVESEVKHEITKYQYLTKPVS